MLRPFQVNVGKFLPLDRDILPTARVSELCEAVQAVSGEDASSQVLLASDGRQMNPSETIGAYSITESQPVFVFYRSHLMSPDPPLSPSPLPYRGDLQQQLQLLRLKPTPSIFQKQVALAKRLSEFSGRVCRVCGQLAEEYKLQCYGWRTVLSNCSSIIITYQKHKTLFSKSVEGFHQAKPRFLQLLQEFPAHVKLLQQLPVPSQLQSEDTPTSLYDWISTHDEKNSLQDLGAECQRSLSKVDDGHINSTLKASEQILADASPLLTQEDDFSEKIAHLQSLAREGATIMDTQFRLAQNVQSTSDRALRSGDAGTIADLVLSHHKSLQLMADYCQQLETSGREIEKWKTSLTQHIHNKLKDITQLQKRVADSNNQLVMLHEHVKLARKRFEILEQVCSAPDILVKVLSEIERRRLYNSSLEKKTGEVSSLLKRARQEEKLQRKTFFENFGQHFILTLFPELQDRVPTFTVHLPKSLSKSLMSADKDLESIRHLLPENLRSSTVDANCTSVRLLSTPLAGAELQTELSSQVDSTESPLSSQSASKPATTEMEIQTEEYIFVEEVPKVDKARLDETKLQLESVTQEMLRSREHFRSEKEDQEKLLNEERFKSTQLLVQIEKLSEDKATLQHLREELELKITEKNGEILEAKAEREKLHSSVDTLTVASEQLTHELEMCRTENLELKSLLQQREKVILENKELYREEKDSLEQCVSELRASRDKLFTRVNNMEEELKQCKSKCQRLNEMNEMRQEQIEHLSSELEGSRSEKEVLIRQANQVQDLANISQKLQDREHEIQCLNQELNHMSSKLKISTEKFEEERKALHKSRDELQSELLRFKEKNETERKRYDTRYQHAQVAISNLKSQLEKAQVQVENAESRAQESLLKLRTLEESITSTNNDLVERLEVSEKQRRKVEEMLESIGNQKREIEVRLEASEKQRTQIEEMSLSSDQQRRQVEEQLEVSEKQRRQIEESLKSSDKQRRQAEEMLESSDKQRRQIEERFEVSEKQRTQVEEMLESNDKHKRQLEERLVNTEKQKMQLEQRFAVSEKQRRQSEELNKKQMKEIEEKFKLSERLQKETQESVTEKVDKMNALKKKLSEYEREKKELIKNIEETEKKLEVAEGDIRLTKTDKETAIQLLRANEDKLMEEKKQLEEHCADIKSQRDSHMKHAMEVERELKELKRDMGLSPPTSLEIDSPLKPKPFPPAGPSSKSVLTVSVGILQVGDTAVFINDPYGNFLALSLDEKTYYLNQSSVGQLEDLAVKNHRLGLSRKILCGRLTNKVLVEVRKESNRLRVPVGARLYKVDAEPYTF